jgi:6-phospho-3-hexuloisomerase
MTAFAQQLDHALTDLRTALEGIHDAQVEALTQLIVDAPRVFVAGKGRSGLPMRGFAMRLMHLGLQAHVVDDVTTPAIAARDLLIIGPGSGRTPSLINYAWRARIEEAHVALITTAADSPVAEKAHFILTLAATTPKTNEHAPSALPMGGVFETALGLLLDITILQMIARMGTDERAMMTRHANLE